MSRILIRSSCSHLLLLVLLTAAQTSNPRLNPSSARKLPMKPVAPVISTQGIGRSIVKTPDPTPPADVLTVLEILPHRLGLGILLKLVA